MSQCSLDGMPEVKWNNDSPTPADWKRLQGPRTADDYESGSPKLRRVMRKAPPIHSVSLDYPLFEESKRAANEIIEALQKASKESDNTMTRPVQLNLTIPEMDEEEEESDNERVEQDVPFRSLANSSLDIIFDLSGNGEDLAPTAKSAFSTLPVERNSPASDTWTDDDIFTEELLSQVDEELKLTPKKPQVPVVIKQGDIPRESSTPHNIKKCYKVDGKAKNFLNFMVDTAKPPKPSPSKHKTCILDKKHPDNKRKETCIRKSTTLPSERHCRSVVKNQSMMVIKEESKPVNLSIPLEVLEDFMLDDSFAEVNNLKHVQTNQSNGASVSNGDIRKASFNQIVSEKLQQCSNTIPKENIAVRPSTESVHKLASSKCLPNKIRRTEDQPTNCASSCLTGNKQMNQIDFNTRFSSDDEEMLLEAVALTESQRSREKNEDLDEQKASTSQTHFPGGSGISRVDKSKPINNALCETKCTASEIERKKQNALNKRRLKMKQKLV